MKRWLAVFILLFFLRPTQAQFNGCAPGFCPNAGFGGGASGCAQATTFLARTSGLNATHTGAYTNLICGMVSDGLWTKLDAFYVLETQDSTTAGLNLVSTSFTLSAVNSPTFTADQGYAGNGTTSYLESGFNPTTATSPNYTLNSASIFVRSNTNARADNSAIVGNTNAYINPWNVSGNNGSHALNSAGTNELGPTSAQGLFTLSRQGSTSYVDYEDATALGTVSQASTTETNATMTILAAHSIPQFSSRQISMAGWGGGFSASDVANLSSLTAAYAAAVGGP